MFLSVITLIWQLLVLFTCCSGVGLVLRSLWPTQFSPLDKFLFCLVGGLFLAVLVAQNLVYLGIPVRISAWILFGMAFWHIWWCRLQVRARWRTFWAHQDIRSVAVVILLTITFHGTVPIRQGLEWYYGKAHFDQVNYALLAEFLKEEPYSTGQLQLPQHPWLLRIVGFRNTAEELGMRPGPDVELVGIKKERLGQSIINAEISTWSGTDGQGGYAATVIFFIAMLAIALYVFLRDTGINCWVAGSGALLGALLPAVTRLSLNGFLSQTSILFVFPFFGSLPRHRELGSRSFTLFFSLSLAYLVAAYSEIALLGFGTFFLGVIFIREDTFRTKRLMLMSAVLLVALMNLYYLQNLIVFLGRQFYMAASPSADLDSIAPDILTLHGWSELFFGTSSSAPGAFLFDCGAILLGLLLLAGAFLLSSSDRLICGAVLLPVLLVISYLATRTPFSYYPIAKITLTILPFILGLVFVALFRIGRNRPLRVLGSLISLLIVGAAAYGSAGYYSAVLDNEGFLKYVRDPRFLRVCQDLEVLKGRRVLVFETHPWLTPWLCYHARHNDVYFEGRFSSDTALSHLDPFAKVPDLVNFDFVVTRDQIVDLRAPKVSCLALVNDTPAEDRRDNQVRYWIGPPARLRFLAFRPIAANLKLRLAPGPDAATLPVDYFLADGQGQLSRGQLWGANVDVRRMNFPRGLSKLQLSVKAQGGTAQVKTPFPNLAVLDGIEISDVDLNPGK